MSSQKWKVYFSSVHIISIIMRHKYKTLSRLSVEGQESTPTR